MITKFNLFEKTNIKSIEINVKNIDNVLIDKLIKELSIVKKKRFKKRTNRPLSINGHFNKEELGKKCTKLSIDMSNGDFIEAEHTITENENNIKITINEETIYDLNNDLYTDEIMIDRIYKLYKSYLKGNKWKLVN